MQGENRIYVFFVIIKMNWIGIEILIEHCTLYCVHCSGFIKYLLICIQGYIWSFFYILTESEHFKVKHGEHALKSIKDRNLCIIFTPYKVDFYSLKFKNEHGSCLMLNPNHLIQFFWHEISFIAKRIIFAKKYLLSMFHIENYW